MCLVTLLIFKVTVILKAEKWQKVEAAKCSFSTTEVAFFSKHNNTKPALVFGCNKMFENEFHQNQTKLEFGRVICASAGGGAQPWNV